MSKQQWCVVLVANPYPQACCCECDASGQPTVVQIYTRFDRTRFTESGTHPGCGAKSPAIRSHNPYAFGGAYEATSWQVIDPTPRSYDDAMAVCRRMPQQFGYVSLEYAQAICSGKPNVGEREAYVWARDNQGFTGTWEDWQSLDAETRRQYELGAAGIPTE